jgi:hypothetical protein
MPYATSVSSTVCGSSRWAVTTSRVARNGVRAAIAAAPRFPSKTSTDVLVVSLRARATHARGQRLNTSFSVGILSKRGAARMVTTCASSGEASVPSESSLLSKDTMGKVALAALVIALGVANRVLYKMVRCLFW